MRTCFPIFYIAPKGNFYTSRGMETTLLVWGYHLSLSHARKKFKGIHRSYSGKKNVRVVTQSLSGQECFSAESHQKRPLALLRVECFFRMLIWFMYTPEV